MRFMGLVAGLILMTGFGVRAETLDLMGPEAIADAFYIAVKSGDEVAVGQLLAPDVKILEGQHAQQSRGQYQREHMHDDMAFMAGMDRSILDRTVSEDGNIAWVVTHSRITGTYDDRDMDIILRELLVLQQSTSGWQISLIEWASK